MPHPHPIAIIGSRITPSHQAPLIGNIILDLTQRGYLIASGGATGADQFVIQQLLRLNLAHLGTIYSAWSSIPHFPSSIRSLTQTFLNHGGLIVWGSATKHQPYHSIKQALIARNKRLVQHAFGVVAFISGASNGSLITIRYAASKKYPIVVFPLHASLPNIKHLHWNPLPSHSIWNGGVSASYSSQLDPLSL